MNLNDLSAAQMRAIGFLARRQRGNFIDGAERAPAEGRYLAVIDPATELQVAEAPDSSAADVDAAVRSARAAFEDSDWSRMRPADREAVRLTGPALSGTMGWCSTTSPSSAPTSPPAPPSTTRSSLPSVGSGSWTSGR